MLPVKSNFLIRVAKRFRRDIKKLLYSITSLLCPSFKHYFSHNIPKGVKERLLKEPYATFNWDYVETLSDFEDAVLFKKTVIAEKIRFRNWKKIKVNSFKNFFYKKKK